MRRAAILAALTAALVAPAQSQAQVQPYQANDGTGFHDILPPGTAGLYNAPQLASFLATGARPTPNTTNQLPMYSDLIRATPGLAAQDIERYFKDSSFGIKPGDVAREYSPRADVTIQRDKGFGVPHIYGKTREGAMFGAGYVAAEDRLFFMDVLRNAGRGQLAAFAGGAAGNRAMDRETWSATPYTEADLQRQVDQLDDLYGPDGARIQSDVDNYVAGINQYISEARLDPSKLPGEYAALGKPDGPQSWKPTDVIATASLVGGIFGKGDGVELDWAALDQAMRERFGKRTGRRLFRNFRGVDDPEAPTTIRTGRRFPYQLLPKHVRRGSVARPDAGSVTPLRTTDAPQPEGAARRAGAPGLGGLLAFPSTASNALVLSGARTASGKPIAVFGPQVGYFTPQILMEEEIHAPGIDAAGAAFIGVNLYVQLGRGRDYAWSATSAGQDNVDTYALPLCNTDGSAPTKDSMGYRFRGTCEPIEVLDREDRFTQSAGDMTPSGSETLHAERTKMGIVQARAMRKGQPVVYVRLRSTYFHEVDSALGFADFNDPAKMQTPADFQRSASRIGYTFNWFFVNAQDTAYYNSGANPVRPKRLDPTLPVVGEPRFEWRGWDPASNVARYTGFDAHPQVVDQPVMTSWNNKQAHGFGTAGQNTFSSLFRSNLLNDQIRIRLRSGDRKLDLPELIDAMEVAGVTDLRGSRVLPYALKVIGTPADPALRDAVGKLRAWVAAGAPRKDADGDGHYDHADAIRIMDAWWPLWLRAQFEPTLGDKAFATLEGLVAFDNDPNNHGDHLGSAYQNGWYGWAQKDLRVVLERKVRRHGKLRRKRTVKGRFARRFCGKGSKRACRTVLESSLRDALAVPADKLYGGDPICSGKQGAGSGLDAQMCFDAVSFRPTGGATQPLIPWINRPTYQQAVEVGHDVP